MKLKERILVHYRSQQALANVLRVRSPQQVYAALKENTTQVGLRKRIIEHLDKMDARKAEKELNNNVESGSVNSGVQ